MTRYVAFLRGVSPVNAKMPELKRCFEEAGFADVKTVLSSGNVAFNARTAAPVALERKAEAALTQRLGRSFLTIVRATEALQQLLATDPYARFRVPANAKRVVTFLREPPKARLELPIELHDARILAVRGCEVFTVYLPTPHGPVFMTLIEKTLGTEVTTRTWDTIGKCARA
jgi:uncharacterized protein (DUF1697 family)